MHSNFWNLLGREVSVRKNQRKQNKRNKEKERDGEN
jgi:hypothetical protein